LSRLAFIKEIILFVFIKFRVIVLDLVKIKRIGGKSLSLVDDLLLDLGNSQGESVTKLSQNSLFDSEEHRDYLEGIIARGRKSRLLYWTVENFAQYENERFEFGSNWVLLLKAFNSTGKSNALKALEYNLTTKGVGITFAKGLIKHGALEAKITTVWSDGLEVEYYLTRTSLGPRSTFKNGYRVYLREGEERKEVYNTLVDGRFVKITETPSFLKRYFNLAEVNGRYLNLLRGSEGLPVLEQSPASLNKMLSQAADLETAEQAIKKMTDDNKETFQELEVVESRIRVYSQDIVERRHLTKGVLDQLENATSHYEALEESSQAVSDVKDQLTEISDLQGTVSVESISTDALEQIGLIESQLKVLGSQVSLPSVEVSTVSDLEVLSSMSKELEALSSVETVGSVENVSIGALVLVDKLDKAFAEVDSMASTSTIESSSVESLALVSSLNNSFTYLLKLSEELGEESKEKDLCFKESETLLEQLKEEGYPVGVCSHCGHLSITQPFQIGSTVVSPHKHS
jgi:hypothetical protein